MTLLFDTHCHLQDRWFGDDLPAVMERARARLGHLVVCGYDAPSNVQALEIAARWPGFALPAAGFHPHDASEATPAALAELESLVALDEVVAVGELGLDFYRTLSPPESQRAALDAQLEIALRLGKPVSVHSRSAEDAIHPHLAAYANAWRQAYPGRSPGVMHCFGGTLEQARSYVDLGFAISVACAVTYPKNDETRRLAAGLPLDALVVETDAPYLPPQPIRGQRNEPAYAAAVAEAIAAARGTTTEAVIAATTANAGRVFGIPVPARATA